MLNIQVNGIMNLVFKFDSTIFHLSVGLDALQSKLKAVPMPIMEKDQCERSYREHNSKYFSLHNSLICGGGKKNVDTCKGDLGGPLVCNSKSDPDRFVQLGIISATLADSECGQSEIPRLFASLPYGICFIKSAIECAVSN